ncbi:hemagglutinin repeat-containing protein [Sodalis praecaptivus]|uniref:hemagglutinin repeat-containing protein n=1 Tax=Sodalis praecaptivus TaxID=1239307 RepID=UPI0027F1B729|nr:hemagglutinin repeat-containing protein [Sodalis praecaptivus]CAJ0998921.1 hypothetical protein NVIRENTERO_03570 [Sodalis praecaptivus]
MDLKLDAARDITLYSAQNIKNTVRHNSSEGGHIGVGIGAGSGGYGISVSAGVNVDQGHEKKCPGGIQYTIHRHDSPFRAVVINNAVL